MNELARKIFEQISADPVEVAKPKIVRPEDQFSFNPGGAVGDSKDLNRILALPRRPAEPPPGVVERMTEQLRRPNGTMTLRPIQAWALSELQDMAKVAKPKEPLGLCGLVGLGEGKTGLSLLAFTILNAKRGVYLVPPQLKAQLVERDHPLWASNFRVLNLAGGANFYPDVGDGLIYICSYSELSSKTGADVLERIRPDVILADEFHLLRNSVAARTKRFRRYLRKSLSSGELRSLSVLSGTLAQKTIMDFDVLKYVLGDRAPVPHSFPALTAWAEALDASDWPGPPGDLVRLCKAGEEPSTGFRRRLTETPGIITSPPDRLGLGLEIHERKTVCPPEVAHVLRVLREEWSLGGEDFADILTLSGKARQVAAGMYTVWEWNKDVSADLREEWKDARKEYYRWLRKFLQERARPRLDSPGFVEDAIRAGLLDCPEYQRWLLVKDQCKPETVPVWISDWLVKDAAEWAHKEPGIVFYSHKAFGEELARVSGLPLYDSTDTTSDLIKETGSRSIIASLNAIGTGLNLHKEFHRVLFTTTASSSVTMQQAIGRVYRQGQPKDTVFVDLYRHTPEMCQALESAHREAEAAFRNKNQSQLLLDATYGFSL